MNSPLNLLIPEQYQNPDDHKASNSQTEQAVELGPYDQCSLLIILPYAEAKPVLVLGHGGGLVHYGVHLGAGHLLGGVTVGLTI